MAKDIVMNVLTSAGYEAMYPFSPRQILNASVTSSTAQQYNITIAGIPSPLTTQYGNDMGIIAFIPTVENVAGLTISINNESALQVFYHNGNVIGANVFKIGKLALLRYYNGALYTIIDKDQIGLSNVDNTSDANKPISTLVQNALNSKLNTPIMIPANSNLNTYQTAGLYYNPANADVATMANAPVPMAFSLFVEQHAGCKQTFTVYETSGIRTWVRNYYSGTWGAWSQVAMVSYGTGNPSGGQDGNIYIKYS